MNQPDRTDPRALDRLFAPKSVALVGASATPSSIGDRQYRALLRACPRPELYLVNPRRAEIDGRRVYASLAELPVVPDVAIVLVRAALTFDAVGAAIGLGVPYVIVGSAGFDQAGRDRLRALVSGTGTRLVGPNSEGLVDWTRPIPLTFNAIGAAPPTATGTDEPDPRPRIGIVSHSGALAFAALAGLDARGARVTTVVSTGDEADLDLCDFLEYGATSGGCDVLALTVESLGAVPRFLCSVDVARAAGCQLVALWLGTSAGTRAAVESHTGRATTSARITRAVFDRCGIAVADDLDTLVALAAHRPPTAPGSSGGRRVAVVSAAGGPAILAADHLLAAGFEVPELPASLRSTLDELLPPYAATANPVDVSAQVALGPVAASVVERLMRAAEVDGVLLVGLLGYRDLTTEPWPRVLAESGKPLVVWSYTEPTEANRALLNRSRTGWATTARGAAAVMAAALAPPRHGDTVAPPRRQERRHGRIPVDFPAAAEDLATAGVPVVPTVAVSTPDDAVAAAAGREAVLKSLPDGFGAKTDWGGVVTHVGDAAGIRSAFRRLTAAAAAAGHQPRIVVQPQITGHEVLVGAVNNADGAVLTVVGSGGVLTDLVDDAAFRLAPLSARDSREWVAELAIGRRVLAGFRDLPPCPIDPLAELVARFSRWATGLPTAGWSSIELNPVIVTPARAVAVDIRITS
ncbi:acetate--CoA ligase family protein [Actinophytocola sp.]|uniref:acetate--CoA ligase family protein n=1 Tax=Actinophytocola sp. TaxID=1872138 RepID=UPI003D6B0F07